MRYKTSVLYSVAFIFFGLIFILFVRREINKALFPTVKYEPKQPRGSRYMKFNKIQSQDDETPVLPHDTSIESKLYSSLEHVEPQTFEIYSQKESTIDWPEILDNYKDLKLYDPLDRSPTEDRAYEEKLQYGIDPVYITPPSSDEIKIQASLIENSQVNITTLAPNTTTLLPRNVSSIETQLERSFIPFQKKKHKPPVLYMHLSNIIPRHTYDCCSSNRTFPYRKNILFVKVHKCASSTVQNIIMRFGLRNELDFVLPHFYYISYYSPFNETLLPAETRTANGKYNILTHSVRYSPALKSALYPDAVSVTILRSPFSIYEGMYNYISNRKSVNFTEFLKYPEKMPWGPTDFNGVYRGYNQLSSDLGLQKENHENETVVRSFIRHTDKEFDLVMIVEHLDESLVLLAHLMGWPLDHVAYLSINQRRKTTEYQLTKSDKIAVKKLNQADIALYNYFLKKFSKCREQFGIELLQEEVKKLQALNEALRQKCVLNERVIPVLDLIGYNLKNFVDWDCIYSTKFELMFTEDLRFRQSQRLFSNETVH